MVRRIRLVLLTSAISTIAAPLMFLLCRPSAAIKTSNATLSASLTPTDWSNIRAAYEAGRHATVAVDGGHRARNPGQRWSTRFDDKGFSTTPDGGGWTWGLELVSCGGIGDERTQSDAGPVKVEGQRITRDWNSNLTEWYVNDARGLEHGFTIRARLNESVAGLRLTLAVRGDLAAEIQDNERDVHFVKNDGNVSLTYSGLTVVDADERRVPAHFESISDRLCITIDDRNARYPLTVDPLAQQAYLKASNTEATDAFGTSVAIAGDTVVVGAPAEDSSATGVNGDESSNGAIDSGAAYVFVRNGQAWTQQAYLKASNTGDGDLFGYSVAASGDTVVVGAWRESSSATGVNGNQSDDSAPVAGAAYVFVRSGSSWSQQAYLKASNAETYDQFGAAVSISGNTIVIGANQEWSNATGIDGDQSNNNAGGSGAAYVFVRNGVTWSQQAYVKASNTEANDDFGTTVAISGDTLAVGAAQEGSNATGINGDQSNNSAGGSGAVYVFVRNGVTWSQQAYVKASNTGSSDFFGISLSISGETLVVGAAGEDSNATGVNGVSTGDTAIDAGAVYVFVRNGSAWSQQAFVKASTAQTTTYFGRSVSVSGNALVVGATGDKSASTGIDGDPLDSNAFAAGAAYVFLRQGTVWAQKAYVKASNTKPLCEFGYSVSISGAQFVVGSPGEPSQATGVNGDQSDTTARGSGAAYTFSLDSGFGASTYGTGTPGCSGSQTLAVNQVPKINSPTFTLTCDHCPLSSSGWGLVGDVPDRHGSLDPYGVGVILHIDVFASTGLEPLAFTSDASGTGVAGYPIVNRPALVGKTLYAQAFWPWTTCSIPPNNVSSSRGLAFTIQGP